MKISKEDNRLVLRHVPLNSWLFGLIFLVIGGTIAVLAMGLAANIGDLSLLARVGALLAGLVGAALGLSLVVGSPVVSVVFDRSRGEVCVVRRGLFAVSTETHPFADIQLVETVEETDAEGDTYFQLQLVLQSGEKVRLTPQELAHSPGVERMLSEVEAYLNTAEPSSAPVSALAKDSSQPKDVR